MIRIFTSPSCSSCRKVKAWFDEQKIPYEAVNIFGDDFTKDDIRELIAKSENGTDDIISPRCWKFPTRSYRKTTSTSMT